MTKIELQIQEPKPGRFTVQLSDGETIGLGTPRQVGIHLKEWIETLLGREA